MAMTDGAKLASYISTILGMGLARPGANFGPARPGGREFVLTPNNATKRGDRLENVSTALNLAERMISEPIDFDAGIVYIPGARQDNAGLVRTPENLESFIRQTEQEHKDALTQFTNNPKFKDNPEKAAQLGIRAEEGLPKWWNDKDPRRPVTPTSSCVSKARIGANGDIYVTFGSNPSKEYQYQGSPDPVEASKILRDLVTAGSIGHAVNSWTGEWGKDHTYLPKG